MKYSLVLASNSPRRRELLAGLGLPFQTRVLPDIAEDYPEGLPLEGIAEYVAVEKAEANRKLMAPGELLITADTIVLLGSKVYGKPANDGEARQMLRELSGNTHKVITGVCLTAEGRQRSFSVSTDVRFKTLSREEIDFYVEHFHPTDKAGAYGIQEWIGYIGVESISGSYFNVMGLPVQRLYTELLCFNKA